MIKEYKNGRFEGEFDSLGNRIKGTFYYKNGDKYVGSWFNEK